MADYSIPPSASTTDLTPTIDTLPATVTIASTDLVLVDLPAAPVDAPIDGAEAHIHRCYEYEVDFSHVNTKSTVTPSQISDIRTLFNIPREYKLRVPKAGERMYWRPEGKWVAIPIWALKYGFRFPLHEFIISFLCFVGIEFAQLVPNAYIHLVSFIAICHELVVSPDLDFFLVMISVRRSKEPGLRQLNRVPGRATFAKTPSSNKGWHEQWIFAKGTNLQLLPNWSSPEDVIVKVSIFLTSRRDEF